MFLVVVRGNVFFVLVSLSVSLLLSVLLVGLTWSRSVALCCSWSLSLSVCFLLSVFLFVSVSWDVSPYVCCLVAFELLKGRTRALITCRPGMVHRTLVHAWWVVLPGGWAESAHRLKNPMVIKTVGSRWLP
jgi:hypothetical protein